MTPTQRTLAECKRRNWLAAVVERFNSFTKRRHDMFGCIDVVAITPSGILGIQATGGDGGHHANRTAKILAEPRMLAWLNAGARLEVWSWRKGGARGKRKLWLLRAEPVLASDFAKTGPGSPATRLEPSNPGNRTRTRHSPNQSDSIAAADCHSGGAE